MTEGQPDDLTPGDGASAPRGHDSDDTSRRPGEACVGDVLGLYTLQELLGEGGFGAVWIAEQRQPVRRSVALKLLKAGMASRDVLLRFEAERQALALMDHPSIAAVLDAGTTDLGTPYFVMEYVPGRSLVSYCDHATLALPDRLRLFIQVCQAVQHAHQKGVIHRDLKPDNVLVSEDGGRPLPRVIDFGIAKAIASPLTESTLQTGAHQVMGTPAYMSPEQASGSADVDTRADVYSLGAVLYQLLTGERPFDLKPSRTTSLMEMLEQIRSLEPLRPSQRVAALQGERARGVSAWRASTHDRLARSLRGDLDWIVMRALEKDRDRRYESPAALAADLERHLAFEPVQAGPPSASYRLSRMVRRHRGLAAGMAVAMLALTGTLAVLAWSVVAVGAERDAAQEARNWEAQARAQAELSAAEARAAEALAEERRLSTEDSLAAAGEVTNFLSDMLSAASPHALGLEATVLQVLDQAAPAIGKRFAGRPRVEAALRNTVGITYRSLGRLELAREHLARARELSQELRDEDDPETLEIERNLVLVDWMAGRLPTAMADIERVHARLAAQLPPDDPRVIETLNVLGIVANELGFSERALAAWTEVAERRQQLSDGDALELLMARHNVALALGRLGRLEQQLEQLRPVEAELLALLGPEAPLRLSCLADVSGALLSLGRKVEALPIAEDVAQLRGRVLGSEHRDTISAQSTLLTLHLDLGHLAQALELGERALATSRRVLGQEHDLSLQLADQLGMLLVEFERLPEALALVQAAYDGRRALLGDGHENTLVSLQNLAAVHSALGQRYEAMDLYAELVALSEAHLGVGHHRTLRARYVHAVAQHDLGALADAERSLRAVVEDTSAALSAGHEIAVSARANLAWVLLDLQQWDEAEELLLLSHQERTLSLGPDHELTVNALEGLARLYRDSGRETEFQAIGLKLYGGARRAAEGPDATPRDMYSVAWYLCEGPVQSLHDPAQAVVWAERANEATGFSVPRYLDTLCSARFAAGDIEGAADAQRRALEFVPPGHDMRGYHEEVLGELLRLLAGPE